MKNPTAFISYAWENKAHMSWVRQFASRLREDYIDAKLDQWEAIPGDQLPVFMEKAISKNDFVLLICTPTYKKKSEARHGGVGYEGDIITAEVYEKQNHRKFIPLLVKGEWKEAAPSWMRGKYFIDLRDSDENDENYKKLLNTLLGTSEAAPPLGKQVTYSYPKAGTPLPSESSETLSLADKAKLKLLRAGIGVAPGQAIHLPAAGAFPASTYIFAQNDIDAINVTIAAGRPLIILAEPGMGESEFARAVSIALDRIYIRCRMSRSTKIADLLWRYDPNERLLEAQLLAQRADIVSDALSISRFVSPAAIWWALDWPSASQQAANAKMKIIPHSQDTNPEHGVVLHIEAIDRADEDVLLDLAEILENSSFATPDNQIIRSTGIAPLIIMTSNMEKALPSSLIRRCIVLQLRAPQDHETLVQWLVMWGRTHFPASYEELLEVAAETVARERLQSIGQGEGTAPSKTEYLDLLRVILSSSSDLNEQRRLLEIAAQYTANRASAG